MSLSPDNLWLIPTLPLLTAGLTAVCRRERRRLAAGMAIGSMALALGLSIAALARTLAPGAGGAAYREVRNFDWFQLGGTTVKLGWVLDPLSAAMLVMVSLVGLVIFIYSVGYMAHDANFTRFFGFLSLFAAGMLGLVASNSLLLLFIGWEVVGLTSYLLIGFWFHKPSAAAAAKKAFLVTRLGDLALFVGMLWLYRDTGTLLFYDGGKGCLEQTAIAKLVMHTLGCGMAASTAIALLIFGGAIGKSGQVPLHVWLPDAMEGPTPVSALIHAATMVAAGVFLVARVYPLMSATEAEVIARRGFTLGLAAHQPLVLEGSPAPGPTRFPEVRARIPRLESPPLQPAVQSTATPLRLIAWIGAVTAVFAALIAVAQPDIKRILAYSTISQLGYMMLGLGVGGVAIGVFHLLTHSCFKALLFLGAGSAIHGGHGEQDIRRMGGLGKAMPVTFATYAIGMMALAGVIPFAGFWSKDAILHAAQGWSVSTVPFYLGVFGALVTAFYMTRQVCYVFLGTARADDGRQRAEGGDQERETEVRSAKGAVEAAESTERMSAKAPLPTAPVAADVRRLHSNSELGTRNSDLNGASSRRLLPSGAPHESPPVMTVPLVVLAVFAALLGFVGTPAWPWLQRFLGAAPGETTLGDVLPLMLVSTLVAAAGIGLGWLLYGRRPPTRVEAPDVLERLRPAWFRVLRERFFVDELYDATVVRWTTRFCRFCHAVDAMVLEGLVTMAAYLVLGVSWLARLVDEYAVNRGFDRGCERLRDGGGFVSRLQDGQVQNYLRVLGVSLTVFLLLLLWGCHG